MTIQKAQMVESEVKKNIALCMYLSQNEIKNMEY